jgi:hypothetical protein
VKHIGGINSRKWTKPSIDQKRSKITSFQLTARPAAPPLGGGGGGVLWQLFAGAPGFSCNRFSSFEAAFLLLSSFLPGREHDAAAAAPTQLVLVW